MPPTEPANPAGELITIRDFLRFAVSRFSEAGLFHGHGATDALDEAAFLILETLHLPIDRLDPFLDARLTAAERTRLGALIDERVATRKPAAYLTRRAYIQGVPFHVDERAIVPRSFIGELLFSDHFGAGGTLIDTPDTVTRVLDLCTGSGCLAILAAMRFPSAQVDAVDLSPAALEVARLNVGEHGLEQRVTLLEGDLLEPVAGQRYDLIIANPPYVSAEAMAALPPEYRHEPALALAGGEDGLDLVRRILAEASVHLGSGGALICEIGSGRDLIQRDYPEFDFLWLDTEHSEGEVFWITREALDRRAEPTS